MESAKILVVDDDPDIVAVLDELLRKEGHQVTTCAAGADAIAAGRDEAFDVVVVDIRLPDVDGLAVLRAYQETSPDAAVIVTTAFGTVETAIEAIKTGAYDYIPKPFKLDEVRIVVRRALERKRLLQENRRYRQELRGKRADAGDLQDGGAGGPHAEHGPHPGGERHGKRADRAHDPLQQRPSTRGVCRGGLRGSDRDTLGE